MKISYAITVCNELDELRKLLDHMIKNIDSADEIVVFCDNSKTTPELISYCERLSKQGSIGFYQDTFNNHFANWKNKLKNLCSGDYIFQIDADEIPNEFLIKNLKTLLQENNIIELIWVPRENYVAGLTQNHIIQWSWNVDAMKRINFPDYQARILKNVPHVIWQNQVHEIIVGAVAQATLPAEPRFCLLHEKTIEKQEKQNNFYDQLSTKEGVVRS